MKLPVSPHLQNKKKQKNKKKHINVANQIEFLLNENVYLSLRSDSEHAFEATRKWSALCLDSNFHFFFLTLKYGIGFFAF